jgi:vancomycin resistance protein YoaR
MDTRAPSSQAFPKTHRLIGMVSVFFALWMIFAIGISIVYEEFYAYSDRIFGGVMVGSLDAGGLTKQELAKKLESTIDTIKRQGIEVRYTDIDGAEKLASVPLENISFQSDIPIQALGDIVLFDAQKTAEHAYAQGRDNNFFQAYGSRISLLFAKRTIPLSISLNRSLFLDAIKKELLSFELQAHDAGFTFNKDTKTIFIEPETSGRELDSARAVADTMQFLKKGERPRIILAPKIQRASLPADNLLDFKNQAQSIIEHAPIILSLHEKTWEISAERLASWLTIGKNSSQQLMLSLSQDTIASYSEEYIAPFVRKPAKTALFEMKDGRVTAFRQEQAGEELDIEQSSEAIRSGILEKEEKTIPLVTKKVLPPLTTEENKPTIKDILAEAETDFKGSPKNRIFNITLGAQRIHGVLIEPGKEFSLISFLGKIDETSGFLPELVIKGSKTTPEFGGGLCQVSTTLFRTVAAAGLPILERKNHSYRVSYYEPPIGFDATVYYPKPDFRFLNDTDNPVLIQTAVHGTKIKMTLWGVQDKRIIEIDAPTVFNRKPVGPTKIIETDTLKPGEEKCIERAHAGADAVFERRVTYAHGEIKKDVFKSHYVTWPAVCMVGKRTDEIVPAPEMPTSTQSSTSAPPSLTSTQKKTP